MSEADTNREKTPSDGVLEAGSPSPAESTSNVVGWDGPGDAANPINWPGGKRWAHVIVVAILGLVP